MRRHRSIGSVARSAHERQPFICIGESTYFSGLYVDDAGRLAKVAPDLRNEDLSPNCACCTHTFNGVVFVRKYVPPV